MEPDVLLKLCKGVVDFLWKSHSPQVQVDHSVRDCIAQHIRLPVLRAAGSPLEPINEAYKRLITTLQNDHRFTEEMALISENVKRDFLIYYNNFGGRSALFALCLALSLTDEDTENVRNAKLSLLNWYSESRRRDYSALNGNIGGAWFPFEWFMTNFDAIAASFIAAGLFELSRLAILPHVRTAFNQAIQGIRQHFSPYPEPLLRAKGSNMTIEDFKDELRKTGLEDRFLYLFQLSDEEMDTAIEGWASALISIIESLLPDERRLFDRLIDETIPIGNSNIDSYIERLREQGFVQIIEIAPEQLRCVLYPRALEFEDG